MINYICRRFSNVVIRRGPVGHLLGLQRINQCGQIYA